MRYPEGNRRRNSISISGDGAIGSGHPAPLRFPSSSSTSQESQNSLPEQYEENDLPGRTPGSTTAAGGGGGANIETISEHVLFGNNNGHNSFLYLYYSSSSSNQNTLRNSSDNLLRRPYTTTGGIKGGKIMGSEDGESRQQKQQQWNDLSGGRGSAGPSPLFYNNNEENNDEYFRFDEGGKKGRMKRGDVMEVTLTNSESKSKDSHKKNDNNNACAPYPVYLSPVEGSPTRSLSVSPKQKSGEDDDEEEGDDEEDTRTSSRITGGPRQDRLDSFGADLLDDDWDKIYSVPDVDSRYIMSPDGPVVGTKRKQSEQSGPISSSSTYQLHNNNTSHKKQESTRTIIKQPSTTSSNNLSVSKASIHSSANSPSKLNKQGSIKRVRVTPDEGKWGGGAHHHNSLHHHHHHHNHHGASGSGSMKKWGSSNSLRSGGNGNKLTPSGGHSRTPSSRSMKRGNSTRHGVTHHHHEPLSGGSVDINNSVGSGPNSAGGIKNVKRTNTGDGLDQMSFNFRNGIGAFFGTPASKQISQRHEPTPEEMLKEEMQGWRPRLAMGATIFTATLLILSCASLLFVFPILVDPILVGFEARFSQEPVMCRTTNFRNGSGPSECATPSCREGCTLDLFNCIFVDVEYYTLNSAMNDNLLLEPRGKNTSASAPDTSYDDNTTTAATEIPDVANATSASTTSRQRRSATLLINVNGCGYPPEVTCSDFEKKYAPLNTQFPCFYSQQNESIVVPDYRPRTEMIHLILAVTIPFGIIIVSAIALYLLVRYHKYLKLNIYKQYAQRKKAVRAKWREEWEKEKAEEDAKNGIVRNKSDNVEEDAATSISMLEPQEEEEEEEFTYRKNITAMQNGASKTGVAETRLMLDSTEM